MAMMASYVYWGFVFIPLHLSLPLPLPLRLPLLYLSLFGSPFVLRQPALELSMVRLRSTAHATQESATQLLEHHAMRRNNHPYLHLRRDNRFISRIGLVVLCTTRVWNRYAFPFVCAHFEDVVNLTGDISKKFPEFRSNIPPVETPHR